MLPIASSLVIDVVSAYLSSIFCLNHTRPQSSDSVEGVPPFGETFRPSDTQRSPALTSSSSDLALGWGTLLSLGFWILITAVVITAMLRLINPRQKVHNQELSAVQGPKVESEDWAMRTDLEIG